MNAPPCTVCAARKYPGESLSCCGSVVAGGGAHGGSVHANMPRAPAPPQELCEIIEPERARRGEPFDRAGFRVWKEHARQLNQCVVSNRRREERFFLGARGKFADPC